MHGADRSNTISFRILFYGNYFNALITTESLAIEKHGGDSNAALN